MKALFDAVRAIAGRGLSQAEVDRINSALEGRVVPDSPDPVDVPRTVGAAGIALIKQFEGCGKAIGQGRFMAYADPGTGGKPWTIGWGSTTDAAGLPIRPQAVWSQAQCDAQLQRDLARFAHEVAAAIGGRPTTQAQFDALVSFHYNTGAIARATLTARHRAGDHAGAAAEFTKWVNAGGKRLPGLVRRRAAEAALYNGG